MAETTQLRARRRGRAGGGRVSGWRGGYAEWEDDGTVFLSVAFTWLLDHAFARAVWHRERGVRVRAGGPAVFLKSMKHRLEDVAECGGVATDAVYRHNPNATFASRGCSVGCWFCIVPAMEGRDFTLLPDFPVRPVLCDNNLSALPADFQDHIVARYVAEGVPLLDANSGFEPRTFTPDVYARWRTINRGPWRYAFDDQQESAEVEAVCKMLAAEPAKKKRVYVLIGNEPVAECMDRLARVIGWGCEPHVQPFIKLNALQRKPDVRHDWTLQGLTDVARWANARLWRSIPFDQYERTKRRVTERYDKQSGLFAADEARLEGEG